MPVATPIAPTAEALGAVRYNPDGLVPAIVQEHGTGAVLMLAWMNADSLRETLAGGRTVFWSRSRNQRWRKGDTSGERQWVRQAYYDCDGDTILLVVEQEGAGACHTGAHSCFHRSFDDRPQDDRPLDDGPLADRPLKDRPRDDGPRDGVGAGPAPAGGSV